MRKDRYFIFVLYIAQSASTNRNFAPTYLSNLRQSRNVIERSLIVCRGPLLAVDDLSAEFKTLYNKLKSYGPTAAQYGSE